MLKKHNEFFKGLLLTSDLCFVSFAWWLAYTARFHTGLFDTSEPFIARHYVIAWVIILGVWAVVFEWADFYRPRRLSTYQRETLALINCPAVALLTSSAVLSLCDEFALAWILVMVA